MNLSPFVDFLQLEIVPRFFVIAGQSFGFDAVSTVFVLTGFACVLAAVFVALIAYLAYTSSARSGRLLLLLAAACTLFFSVCAQLAALSGFATASSIAYVDSIAAALAAISGILMVSAAIAQLFRHSRIAQSS